ncbi:aldose epimerase family protein, partial [Sphaerotilus sulfidivorans]
MKPLLLCLHGPDGLEITLSPRGASWLSCRVPVEGEAQPREVLAGGTDPEDPQRLACYAGATVGRWANRIAGAVLRRDGHVWPLLPHPAGSAHQLHGGPDGWSHRLWCIVQQAADQVVFALHSPGRRQGFS